MTDTKTTEPSSGGDKPDTSGYAFSRQNTQPRTTKDPARRQGVIARPKTSKRSPRQIRMRQRQRQALQMRLRGWSYERIGKELRCGKSQIERDISNVMIDMVAEPSAQLFKTEMAQLDAVLAGHFEAACAGNNAAAYVCLRIAELRGQFLGWDRPDVAARLLVSNGDGTNKQLTIDFVLPSQQRIADIESMMRPSRHDHHDHRVYSTDKQIDAVANKPVSVPIVPLPRKPTDWMS